MDVHCSLILAAVILVHVLISVNKHKTQYKIIISKTYIIINYYLILTCVQLTIYTNIHYLTPLLLHTHTHTHSLSLSVCLSLFLSVSLFPHSLPPFLLLPPSQSFPSSLNLSLYLSLIFLSFFHHLISHSIFLSPSILIPSSCLPYLSFTLPPIVMSQDLLKLDLLFLCLIE